IVIIIVRCILPKDVARPTALHQSLSKFGINTDIQSFPSGKYTGNYAGAPAFLHSHGVGLMFYGWGADWPSGLGFLQQIAAGRAIKGAGNSNITELNAPTGNGLFNQATSNPTTPPRGGFYPPSTQQRSTRGARVPD